MWKSSFQLTLKQFTELLAPFAMFIKFYWFLNFVFPDSDSQCVAMMDGNEAFYRKMSGDKSVFFIPPEKQPNKQVYDEWFGERV